MAANGISTLAIPTGITATSYTQASSYLVAVGTFNYDAYGAGFAIRKDGGAIDAYMAQVIALGAGTRNWTFVPGNGQPSFTRSMTQPDGTNESNDPSESGVDIWNVATAAGNLSGAGENQINISLIPNGTAFTIYATELGGGGGADKESRQTAKLDLAQTKRQGTTQGSALVFSGSAQLSLSDAANLKLGDSTAFTIEFWIYTTAYPVGFNAVILQKGGLKNVNYATYQCTLSTDSKILFDTGTGAGGSNTGGKSVASSTNLPLSTWTHIAVVWDGTNIKLYQGGVQVGTTAANPLEMGNNSSGLTSGNITGGSDYFTGSLSNIRIAKNVAVYTGAFTVPAIPLASTQSSGTNITAITGTSTGLLLNATSSATYLTDSSSYAATVSNSSVTWSASGPSVINNSVPFYRARNVYDPDRLPTQYSGYTVVDNANAEGLLRARPWTAYDINPTATIVNEGGTLTVNIALLEILDGTTVYWSVSNSGDFGTALGTFVVNNDSGSFTVTPTKDLSTEGTETFDITLRRGSSSGTVVATFSSVSITDVSLTPTITPAANSVDEGSSLSFTVTNLGPNGTYYWTINHVTTANADFSAVNGSFSLTGGGAQDNGTGSFNITTIADTTTEGAQTFTVSVRSGSISGTVIVTSGSITVNDTSLTASGDTAGLYRTTYTGYFADDPAWFATATVSSAAVNLSPIGDGDPGFEPFSVQLLGYFKPTTTETHTFFLSSDDASFMWLGATAVTGFTTANAFINNGGIHGSVEVSASIALTAGVYYPIRIQMGDQGGGDVLELNYSTPTIVKTTTVTGKIFYNSATNGF